ncbi:pentapeptide repeat-containing protein [Jannaschia marina]|uniref:pentapeptide repeat-containing protein n=1 Tax=Jannaschia marina TaxID=2741674 RepID=UPI0015C859E6|nr:pentapeptide repeat-containing protein [Jannaschia marina]
MTRFLEWLGLTDLPNFSRARPLGAFLGFVLMLCVLLGLAVAVAAVARLAGAMLGLDGGPMDSALVRNLGLLLVALFGAPFLVWRTMVAQRQADTADAALLNEKIRDAATGLSARRQVSGDDERDRWEDDVVARVRAIDTLEALAGERPDEARRIERLLASYVRGTFPARSLEPTEELERRKAPRLDLQAAVSALGRLHGVLVARGEVDYRLDLRTCDFDGVDFSDGNFFAADLAGSRMEGAVFQSAIFDGCRLWGCLLNYGAFHGANFKGAKFDRATLNKPIPATGGMNEFVLAETLIGATFIGADMRAVDYLGEGGDDACTFGTSDTRLNENLLSNETSQSDLRLASRARSRAKRGQPLKASEDDALRKVDASCLRHWSHVKNGDLMLGGQVSDFYEALDMKRWPYWEGH